MENKTLFRILAVDDEPGVLASLKVIFEAGYNFITAPDAGQALSLLKESEFHVAIIDIGLPDMNGIELLKKFKESSPDIESIVLTADTSLGSGIKAMKAGAYDYVVKPFGVKHISAVVKNAAEKAVLAQSVRNRRAKRLGNFKKLIGKSEGMNKVFISIEKLAKVDATALVIGESGTGKELVAQTIHNGSKRKDNSFVPVNCGAIPESLLESELFGHEKGAFTDAYAQKTGKFEVADKGTIFLDEISSLPIEMQAKLLRALQERVIERVGGTKQILIDVRIIAATNVNLEELIKQKKFREDLYYRLNIVPIRIPPLRDRKEDIPLLVNHFREIYNKEYGRQIKEFSPQVMKYFINQEWRGNVRELENIVQRLFVICSTSSIKINRLPLGMTRKGKKSAYSNEMGLEEALRNFESNYIMTALEKAEDNRYKAAELLGIHRNTLLNRMKVLGLE
jgi:DNA-binding NtrC family response regulator